MSKKQKKANEKGAALPPEGENRSTAPELPGKKQKKIKPAAEKTTSKSPDTSQMNGIGSVQKRNKSQNTTVSVENNIEQKDNSLSTSVPSPLLFGIVGAFLDSNGFDDVSKLYTSSLKLKASKDGWKYRKSSAVPVNHPSLSTLFEEWRKEHDSSNAKDLNNGREKNTDKRSVQPSSNQMIEKHVIAKKKSSLKDKTNPTKASEDSDEEKSTTSGSDSGSESTTDSSESDSSIASSSSRSLSVKASLDDATSSSTSDPEESSSDDESEDESSKIKVGLGYSRSADGVSDSSDTVRGISSIADSKNATTKKDVAASSSDSSSSVTSTSDSDSDSDSSSASEAGKDYTSEKHASRTIAISKPPPTTPETPASNPAKRKQETLDTESATKRKKVTNAPFQRIPSDTKVDPRVSSNAYVPYEYADRAYQDLVITKGKGFTKEKNKKKRGSYRGGAIDVSGGGGVLFD